MKLYFKKIQILKQINNIHSIPTLIFIFCIWNILLVRASGSSREKKSNFAGFSGTNSRKKWLISWEFCGNFRGQFR